MRILGIDPGLAIVGFGLIEAETGKTQMLQYGAVTTPAGLPLAARLVQLERDMEELIAQLRPEAIAVEELFFSNNITTGIAVAHARGIILCTAAKSGIPLYEYTPMQVKQAVVGYGLAEKRQVMDMVRRLLKLKAVPRPDDAADTRAARPRCSRAHKIRSSKPSKEDAPCSIISRARSRTSSPTSRSSTAAAWATPAAQRTTPSVSSRRVKSNGFTPT